VRKVLRDVWLACFGMWVVAGCVVVCRVLGRDCVYWWRKLGIAGVGGGLDGGGVEDAGGGAWEDEDRGQLANVSCRGVVIVEY